MISFMGRALPHAVDAGAARFGIGLSKTWRRARRGDRAGNLYAPGRDGDVRGVTAAPVLRAAAPSNGRTPLVGAALLALAGTAAALTRRR